MKEVCVSGSVWIVSFFVLGLGLEAKGTPSKTAAVVAPLQGEGPTFQLPGKLLGRAKKLGCEQFSLKQFFK